MHFARIRVDELLPGKRVVWRVLDNWMSFIDDQSEWTGTEIRFDIAATDGGTEVRFTHVGLTPADQCFELCRRRLGHVHHEEPARRSSRRASAGRSSTPTGSAYRSWLASGAAGRPKPLPAARGASRRYPPYARRNAQPGSDSTVAFVPHWG